MHRTQGEDFDPDLYQDSTNKRGFKAATPPSDNATRLAFETMNAIQEEIANLIERAGVTLQATASADRAAGWEQLYQAIFESEALDSTALKVNSVIESKIQDEAVTTSKIANNAVTGNQISDTALILPLRRAPTSTSPIFLDTTDTSDLRGNKLDNVGLRVQTPDSLTYNNLQYFEWEMDVPTISAGVAESRVDTDLVLSLYELVDYRLMYPSGVYRTVIPPHNNLGYSLSDGVTIQHSLKDSLGVVSDTHHFVLRLPATESIATYDTFKVGAWFRKFEIV